MTDWVLRRHNLDATWQIDLPGGRVVFDPWLTGSEIDGWAGFHESWHTGPVRDPGSIDADIVVLSQPYADHLHPETLAALPPGSVRVGLPGLAGALPVPLWGAEALRVGALRFWRLSPPWWRLPAYHAVIVATDDDEAVVHAPHGIAPDPRVADVLRVRLLATSRTRYRIPWFLGGAVNPGADAAEAARHALRAEVGLVIHDEDKRETGFVARVAHRVVPPADPFWLDPPHLDAIPLLRTGTTTG